MVSIYVFDVKVVRTADKHLIYPPKECRKNYQNYMVRKAR